LKELGIAVLVVVVIAVALPLIYRGANPQQTPRQRVPSVPLSLALPAAPPSLLA
jgi:hypothetical protein